MEEEWFSLASKSVVHLQKQSSTSRNFFKKWIVPNFNNAFHKQKESLRIRAWPELFYFLQNGLPLISTGKKKVISTSGKKAIKSLFV